MRRSFFGFVASLAVLFLCGTAEARSHRHSAYRHINSRGHVSYYHGHGGGRHHHQADIDTPSDTPAVADIPTPASEDLQAPTVRSHRYLYRYQCGERYCYKYPSNHIGSRVSGFLTDAHPAAAVEAPPRDSAVGPFARELGIATAARVRACEEPVEALVQRFMIMLTYNSTRPMSPLGDEAIRNFSKGLQSELPDVTPCPAARDSHVQASVRFLSLFYVQVGRPETAYRVRLNAAQYETTCQSAEINDEGKRISTAMLEKLGLKSAVLPMADKGISDEYAKLGESGCILAARIARW